VLALLAAVVRYETLLLVELVLVEGGCVLQRVLLHHRGLSTLRFL